MFRDKFSLTLILRLPVVFWSADLQEWLGYTAPAFPGANWIAPMLGTVVLLHGGLVFISGALGEVRAPARDDHGLTIAYAKATNTPFAEAACSSFATTLNVTWGRTSSERCRSALR